MIVFSSSGGLDEARRARFVPAATIRVDFGDASGVGSAVETQLCCLKVVVKPAATCERDAGVEAEVFVGVNGGRADDEEAAEFLSRKVQVSGTTIKTWSCSSSGGRVIIAWSNEPATLPVQVKGAPVWKCESCLSIIFLQRTDQGLT